MDKDSCHSVFYTCGHHADPYPGPHPLLSVPYETPPWTPDPEGALAAGIHICSVPVGACATPPHNAAVLHIQPHLEVRKQIGQTQEEGLIYNQTIFVNPLFGSCVYYVRGCVSH